MIYAVNLIPLRPGVSPDAFERFAVELDQPACLAHDVVQSFETYTVTEPICGEQPSAQILEVMGLRSWSEWVEARDNDPALAEAGRDFTRLADPATVTTFLTRRLSR